MAIGPPSRARLRAIIQQRCPNCLQGQVFEGLIRMKEECPVCRHRFGRESGYFQGAMYVSYALSIGSFGILSVVAMMLLPSHSPAMALALSFPVFLLLVPIMFRYSRVIWMHLFFNAF